MEKNRTNSAGFIGNLGGKSNVENVFAAGKVDNRTETPLYNFLGTPEVLESMVKNAFVLEKCRGNLSHDRNDRNPFCNFGRTHKRGRILSGFYAPFGRNLESQLSSHEGISRIKRHGRKKKL